MDSEAPASATETEQTRRRAACVACRNSKMKCIRKSDHPDAPCVRCSKAGRECVIVAPKMGRKVGSRNKFTELNQALRSLDPKTLETVLGTTQEAISKTGSNVDLSRLYVEKYGTDDISTITSASQSLLKQVAESSSAASNRQNNVSQQPNQQQPPMTPSHPPNNSMSLASNSMILVDPNSLPQEKIRWNAHEMKITPTSELESSNSPTTSSTSAQMHSPRSPTRLYELRTSQDLSNPLGMLSDVCDSARIGSDRNIRRPMSRDGSELPMGGSQSLSLDHLGIVPDAHIKEGFDHVLGTSLVDKSDTATLMEYFRKRSMCNSEAGDPDLDPINVGVLSEKDVDHLFNYYYTELFPLSTALDARLCSPAFLRRTSPFLLTAVCYSAVHFAPFCDEAMLKRLSLHFEKSCNIIKTKGYRSVSIIHGLLIGSGHSRPVKYFLEEKAWSNFTHALSIAIELGLHRIFSADETPEELQHSNSEMWLSELELNGIDLNSPEAGYFQRHAERSYLHLHLWGSGLASSLNRPWKIQYSNISLEKVKSWHENPLSIPEDHVTVALIMLRHHSADLIAWIKPVNNGNLENRTTTNFAAIRNRIDSELGQWHLKWLGIPYKVEAIPKLPKSPLYLPYLALLYRHTRLLLLSHAFKYHCATIDDPSVPIFDCFQTGLSVVRLTIQELKESKTLQYMVNNIAMCVLYAAVGTLKFAPYLKHENSSLNAVLIGLLGQLAQMMEQAGSNPPQRQGVLQLYGRHLRVLLYNYMISCVGNQSQSTTMEENSSTLNQPSTSSPSGASQHISQTIYTDSPSTRYPQPKKMKYSTSPPPNTTVLSTSTAMTTNTASSRKEGHVIVPQPNLPFSIPPPQQPPPLPFIEKNLNKTSNSTGYLLPFESAHGWIDYNFDNTFEPSIVNNDLPRFDVFPKFPTF